MAVKLSPVFQDAQLDSNGNPAVSFKLYTYAAGSTTQQTTYQDSGANSQHQNPIILNSRGEPPAPIWLTVGQTYKFELQTSAGVTVRTVDNISGVNDTTSSLDQWVSGPAPTYVSATSFTMSGDQTSTFTVGRRLKTTNTGGTVYSTIIASAYGASTTVTVVNDSGTLDSGLSAVSYALLSPENNSLPAVGNEYVCEGRLTLETGVPVSTTDQTAKTSVYFTPFRGDRVDLYDGTKWVRYKFAELTLSVPATTSTMYDVFLKNVSGTLTLAAVAWTNDTTRATALTTQNGVYVKSGDTQSRYLGSFRTTGVSGQTEDSYAKRYVWNYYNRVQRAMRVIESTDSWTYTTATYRAANNSAANQLDFVVGVSEEMTYAAVHAAASNTSINQAVVNIATEANLTAPQVGFINGVNVINVANVQSPMLAEYMDYPAVGRCLRRWIEYSGASGTTTWYGDNGSSSVSQSGIYGWVYG